MSKFKVGDKVIVIKNTPVCQEGLTGTVIGKAAEGSMDGLLYVIARNGDPNNSYYLLEQEIHLLNDAQTVAEYTGGSSNYYKVFIKNPTTLEKSYEAECNDIIEALQMTFAEGNAFKAIWRKAKARQGVQKKGYDNGLYDSEKVVFFGERMVVEAKEKGNESK